MSPLLKYTTHCLTVLTSIVGECQWVRYFQHGGIQSHTFASYVFPCQMSFGQTAPLLPSVTQQQHVMESWWEDSTSTTIPPLSASDVVDQHNKKKKKKKKKKKTIHLRRNF